jgi:hypothetical protein
VTGLIPDFKFFWEALLSAIAVQLIVDAVRALIRAGLH